LGMRLATVRVVFYVMKDWLWILHYAEVILYDVSQNKVGKLSLNAVYAPNTKMTQNPSSISDMKF